MGGQTTLATNRQTDRLTVYRLTYCLGVKEKREHIDIWLFTTSKEVDSECKIFSARDTK